MVARQSPREPALKYYLQYWCYTAANFKFSTVCNMTLEVNTQYQISRGEYVGQNKRRSKKRGSIELRLFQEKDLVNIKLIEICFTNPYSSCPLSYQIYYVMKSCVNYFCHLHLMKLDVKFLIGTDGHLDLQKATFFLSAGQIS